MVVSVPKAKVNCRVVVQENALTSIITNSMDAEEAMKKGSLTLEGSDADKKFFLEKILRLSYGIPAAFSNEGQIGDGQLYLLQNLRDCLGLVFNFDTSMSWYINSVLRLKVFWLQEAEPYQIAPFGQQDLIALEANVKSLNVVSNAKGIVHLHLARHFRNKTDALNKYAFENFDIAIQSFEEVLLLFANFFELQFLICSC